MTKTELISLISDFISQALSGELKTKDYHGDYKGLKLKVSFGQGTPSQVPFIAFTAFEQKVQDGIYPVILFNKEKKQIVSAYGLSATNEPKSSWGDLNKPTIESQQLAWPKYKNCFIERLFEEPFSAGDIANALDVVIDRYIRLFSADAEENNNQKNIILYGPPGVGKTYSHKKLIAILENGDSLEKLKDKDYDLSAFNSVKGEDRYRFVTFHQSYSYEDFIEGFRPTEKSTIERQDGLFKDFCLISTDGVNKKHYLIIDEINRGNISKIFGELITLIEEDKRLGESNELTVTLPYSKERFGVPQNFYIIGTMNTADKSIALVDIALRRRFTFVRMEPLDEYLPQQIKAINAKIKEKLSDDYLIGHAFFIDKNGKKIEDDGKLAYIYKYKIKPLIEEYFYADEQTKKEIYSLLGEI